MVAAPSDQDHNGDFTRPWMQYIQGDPPKKFLLPPKIFRTAILWSYASVVDVLG